MDYSKFDLNCPPFEQAADTAFYHPFPSHQAALDVALDAIENTPGVTLITAPRGIGKTMVARCLLEQLHRDRRALRILATRDQTEDIIRRLARGFALETPADDVTHRIVQMVQRIKVESRGGAGFVAVIDDAQHLSNDDLVAITKLMRAVAADHAPLSLLLVATPVLVDRVAEPSAGPWRSLNPTQCAIKPLEREQIAHYIRHRLRIAGGGNVELFNDAAISAIADASKGVLRRINTLCDAGLRRAMASKADVVDAAHIPDTRNADDDAVAKEYSTSTDHSVAEELGRILADAPQKMARLQNAVERLEQRAQVAVSRTGRRLAELKDQSVRQVRQMPATGADAQRIIEATAEADRVHRRMARFCDQFAEVSATCEQRLSLLVSSLDAAQAVHEKLESLGEGVSELVEDARENAAQERDRIQAMFDEVRARREELSILLESAGETNAVRLAETSETTRIELSRINQSVESARDEWTQLKGDIDGELRKTVALIEDINKQAQDRRKQLIEIRDIERRCTQRATETAKSAELLNSGLRRAAATTQQIEKLTRDIQNAQQAADQAAATLRQILTETDETQARATRSAANARQAATTIDRASKQLGDNVTAAQRIADHLSDFEKHAAQRIDAMIAAAEQNIAHRARQAVARIEKSIESAESIRSESNRIREAAIEQLDETARRINAVKTEATETLQPILSRAAALTESVDQAKVAAVAAVAGARESATAAIKAVADDAVRAQGESVQSAMRAIDAAGQRADRQLGERTRESLQSIDDAKLLGVKAIQSGSAAAVDEARQSIEQDAIEALKRLSASGGRQMAQISTYGEKTREELTSMTQRLIGELTDMVGKAQSGAESLAEQNETADRRCQEVIVASEALAENIEASNKCRDAVHQLVRDVWTVAGTAESRTRELSSVSEQALARNDALRDTIARAKNPTDHLSRTIEQADKTAQALSNQSQGAHKATLRFARSIQRARQANREMESLIERGASVRDELDDRTPQLAQAVQLAGRLIETIESEAKTARDTSAAVAGMVDETAKVRARLVEVQRALNEPVGVIRDAKAQAEELSGICLSVKRIFGAVSRASLDANERIKALHALLTGSQQAQRMLEQWVTEANHSQKRLASAVRAAPSIDQTHPAVMIPNAGDQPLAEILRLTAGGVTRSDTGASRAGSTGPRTKQPTQKSNRLSPEDIRSMIADARANVRNKELSSIK